MRGNVRTDRLYTVRIWDSFLIKHCLLLANSEKMISTKSKFGPSTHTKNAFWWQDCCYIRDPLPRFWICSQKTPGLSQSSVTLKIMIFTFVLTGSFVSQSERPIGEIWLWKKTLHIKCHMSFGRPKAVKHTSKQIFYPKIEIQADQDFGERRLQQSYSRRLRPHKCTSTYPGHH